MSRTIIGKVAVTPRGEYASNVHYYRLDVVSSNGSSYICLNECTGISVNNNEYWQLLVQKPINGTDYNTQEEIEVLKHDVIEQSKTDLASFFDEQEEDFEEILTNYSNGLKSDFDTNASNKTNTFNQNATTKTSDFNTNAEAKTTTFNNNATSETSDFNANAEAKTTTFNNNASSKTTDFNNNASDKTNDFDSNASNKTNEFDDHVDDKIDEFDEHALSYGQKIQDLENNQPINNASGESIDLTDSAESYIRSIKLTGKTVQEGEPTPINPVKIKNCTGSITEKVLNDNLFDGDQLLTADGWTKNANNIYSGTFYTFHSKFNKGFGIKFKENTQYTLSLRGYCSASYISFKFTYTDNSESLVYISARSMTSFSLISEAGKTIKKLSGSYGDGGSNLAYLTEIMLNEGSVAKTYNLYQEQNVSFPLQENQNFMQNDYLADDGIHSRRRQIVFTGNESWTQRNEAHTFSLAGYGLINSGICSHYKNITNTQIGSETGIFMAYSYVILVTDTRFETVEEFKQFLGSQNSNETPVTVEIVQEETITPYTSTQQTAYNQLKNLRTYKGETHILSTDEIPATMDLTYVQTIDIFKEQINDLLTRVEVIESEV